MDCVVPAMGIILTVEKNLCFNKLIGIDIKGQMLENFFCTVHFLSELCFSKPLEFQIKVEWQTVIIKDL